MKVYVIRHGESESNLSGCWTGWLDVALTEKGRADAVRARAVLEGVAFDKVYASDLLRARQTAEIALPNVAYETSELLREIDVGTLSGKPLSTLQGEEKLRAQREGYTDLGGEARAHFRERIRTFIRRLESDPYDTVAIFAHAGWLRGMLCEAVAHDLESKHVRCGNCTVGIFEYIDGIWRLHSWINLT